MLLGIYPVTRNVVQRKELRISEAVNVNYTATAYLLFDFGKVTCLDQFIL